MTSTGNLEKTQALSKKLAYRFLVESTKIKNTTLLYKTALFEANVTTNRMVNTKMDLSEVTEIFQ